MNCTVPDADGDTVAVSVTLPPGTWVLNGLAANVVDVVTTVML